MIRPILDAGKGESTRRVYNHPAPSIADRLARARANLARVVEAMNNPHFELTVEDGAGVVAAFNLARGAGYPFDRFTTALVGVLRRQIGETIEGFEDDTDTDADTSVDDGFENDEHSDREAA